MESSSSRSGQVMKPKHPSTLRREATQGITKRPSWFLAIWLAAIGFVAAGCIVFFLGFQSFAPPQPPPGQANCGTAALGGAFLMFFGTPIAAIASGCVGAFVGSIVDVVRQRRE
jgi:hypothetical protein